MAPQPRIDVVANFVLSWIDFQYAYTLQDIWGELDCRRRFDKSIYFPEDRDELRGALDTLTARGHLQVRDLAEGQSVWCRPGVDAVERRMLQLQVAITGRVEFEDWTSIDEVERTLRRRRDTEDAESSGPFHAFPANQEETRAVLLRLVDSQVLSLSAQDEIDQWRLRRADE